MKRIQMLLISLCLLVNLLPVSVLASQDGLTVAVGAGKSTLSEAVAAIINTDSKKGTIEVVSDIAVNENVTIPAGADITLTDGGNHCVITRMDPGTIGDIFITVESEASLTIDGDLTLTREKAGDDRGSLIACHGSLTLNHGILDFAGNATSGDHQRDGVVTVCGSKAVFTMNGGTIKNARLSSANGGVKICCDGEFILNDGTICDMDGTKSSQAGAVLLYSCKSSSGECGEASFTMNGGTIENNIGYRGIGVYVVGIDYFYRSTMTMNGGTIQNNTCTGWVGSFALGDRSFQGGGAGIFIEANASVTMNGGIIANNIVNGGMGGGVCANDNYWATFPQGPDAPGAWTIEDYRRYYPAAFTMNKGIIKNNKATMGDVGGDGGCGGGVYSASNCVTLKGGVIENNESERQGGGVYVGSIPYELKIYDAVVTGNTASILGGGVWACPTGDTEIFVTNGVGVYGNSSEGAGDDIVSVKTSGQNYVLTLADRILGGGQVQWYKDGGLAESSGNLGFPDGSDRYSDGDAKPITQIQNSTIPYALKAIVSDEAKRLAEESGTLLIRNNHSARGGGIGTNGGIVMGEKDQEYTLKVLKDWGGTKDDLKTPVTVYLKAGETVLDPVTLDKGNNWSAEFTQLPDPATLVNGLTYTVVENPVPEHFEPAYSKAEIDEATRTITIHITNTYQRNGGLTVFKTVSGSAGDTEKEFAFTVTLNDTSINGIFGEMKFTDGVAAFTLKHGESLTAAGLPAGIQYTVEESGHEGYTVTSTDETGVIKDRQTAEVRFNNHKDKPLTPEEAKDSSNDMPDTGDPVSIALIAVLLLAAGVGLTGAIYAWKKKYSK